MDYSFRRSMSISLTTDPYFLHPAVVVHLADTHTQAKTVLALIVHEKAMVEADTPFSS
jgi:hypothetical protein